jgi:hypothetical protein
MKNYGIIALIAIFIGLSGYAIGRYTQPAKVQIKTEVITKEVEVIKKDVRIVEKEIKRPDGTVEKETVTEDNSTQNISMDTDSKQETLIIYKKPDWKVSGLLGINQFTFDKPDYGISIEKRVLGPFFVGGEYLSTRDDNKYLFSIGMEF